MVGRTHPRTVVAAIDLLAEAGPGLGRPWSTRSTAQRRELEGAAAGHGADLFAFDPWRSSILLVAGDKTGRWNAWYREAIPLAEQRYEAYLKSGPHRKVNAMSGHVRWADIRAEHVARAGRGGCRGWQAGLPR